MSILLNANNELLSEFYTDLELRYQIYVTNKPFWVVDPAPKIYKNGIIIESGFTINYDSGYVIFYPKLLPTDIVTGDFSYLSEDAMKTQIAGSEVQLPVDVQDHMIPDDNPVPVLLIDSNIPTTQPVPVQDQGKYLDLGLAIDGVNMAAGATVLSEWINNVSWVRYIIAQVSSDQASQLVAYRRDSSLEIIDWGSTLATITAGGVSYVPIAAMPQQSATGASAILGYSARFGIKNTAAVPNTFAKVRIQLMGA